MPSKSIRLTLQMQQVMKKIEYSITFLSDWICSSGLGAGAETDNETIKDADGLPYIPGRTIKGLLRDAFEEMAEFEASGINDSDIISLFGKKTDDKSKESTAGSIRCESATLTEEEKSDIIQHNLADQLFRNIASTAIEGNGIAKPGSLRTTEVCIPITLHGSLEAEEKYHNQIIQAMKWTRRLGTNRNRGLGRCIIEPKQNPV